MLGVEPGGIGSEHPVNLGQYRAPVTTFGSDNHAGAHPEVLAAVAEASTGHAPGYGDDPWTTRAVELLRAELGEQAQVALAFNGTGANVVGLSALLRPWEHVICTAMSHVNVDETGAPERILGSKLVPVPSTDGKLTPAIAAAGAWGAGVVHHTQPRVVLMSQSTELGTVHTPVEVRALADWAHERGMLLYVDGARIANAAVSCGASLRELVTEAGVDALSFGATKNGAIGAEAVVIVNPALVDAGRALPFARKSTTQLASKMRFVSAQFIALLEDGLWRRNAEHANAMARRLQAAVRDVPGVRITQSVDANAIFAVIPRAVIAPLAERWHFYTWDEAAAEVRWMCAWDTTPEQVDAFAADIAATVSAAPAAAPAGT